MRRITRLLVSALAVGALLGPTLVGPAASGAGENAAGVVVQIKDKIRKDCVRFDGSISGIKLLKRSKFDFLAAKYSFGKAICSIDGKGCKTRDPDRCTDCKKPIGEYDGKFWAYWTQDTGDADPAFSFVGANDRTVEHGSIDYWVWGDGSGSPTELALDDICKS
ncbi:MAG: hypothetical protein WD826_10200 [Actinomycetota bacterium]